VGAFSRDQIRLRYDAAIQVDDLQLHGEDSYFAKAVQNRGPSYRDPETAQDEDGEIGFFAI
jgi:hypothetical protein